MNYRVVVVVLLLVGSFSGSVAGFTGSTHNHPFSQPTPLAIHDESTALSPSVEGVSSPSSDGANAVRSSDRAATEPVDVLHRTTVLRHLPEQTGTFETETTFHVPDSVTELTINLGSKATVVATDGFEPTGNGRYRWTGDTDEPMIRFTMPANKVGYERDHDRSSAVRPALRSSGGGYTFIDKTEWGLVRVPTINVSYRYTEPVGLEETVTVDGPGAAGSDIAFFGEVTEYERTVDGGTIRLAVPAAANLRETPGDVLTSLAAASTSLEVGASHDEVFIVAAPSSVDWAARGIQYGQSDAWVVAKAPLEEPSNVWLHEYVHARQAYANSAIGTTTETGWLVEAQAEYYASTLALEQGLIDFKEFSTSLEHGERSPYADGVLADPTTWRDDNTDYVKGPLVYGELDRQLRLATNGDRTLEDVFRMLNTRNKRVTERAFLEAVEDAGGSAVRTLAKQYTQTEETPEMWSRTDHRAAFDQQHAVIESGLGGPIWVAGEPWSRPADGAADPVTVPVGESVTVPVSAENVGDRAGTADITLEVDGTIVDYQQTVLEVGNQTTEQLTWTPSEPGEYTVQVGSDRFTTLVRAPSSVQVTNLTAQPDRVDPGDPVTATATVTAADSQSGAAVLKFRIADGTVAERLVTVEPGNRTTVEATLTFTDEGRHEIAVENQSTTVAVGGGMPALESTPGFGGPAAVVGVATTTALLARRQYEAN